jgi:hypothetical protein
MANQKRFYRGNVTKNRSVGQYKRKALMRMAVTTVAGFLAFAGLKQGVEAHSKIMDEVRGVEQRQEQRHKETEEYKKKLDDRLKRQWDNYWQEKNSGVLTINQSNGLKKIKNNSNLNQMGLPKLDISKIKSPNAKRFSNLKKMNSTQVENFLRTNYQSLSRGYTFLSRQQQAHNKVILEPYVRSVARKYGIDEVDFVKMIQHESKWDIYAINKSGDVGIAQLNIVLWGNKSNREYVCNPLNPIEALEVSAKYYSLLHKKFKDKKLALTAYNQGPTSVRNMLNKGISSEKIIALNKNNYAHKVLNEIV